VRGSIKTGFSFGLTSGIITTLGLMVGLHSGTHSQMVVIGGILTVAIADAFSDALGIHVSEETENKQKGREIWEATMTTFISKLIFALTFIVPVLFLSLLPAILVSVAWGLLLLSLFSYWLGRQRGADPLKVVLEHLVIALLVIIIAHFVGDWIALTFV
jgi:VIT1/CCC1 family predicted Fe2+/Mn2+ transporter